MQKERPDPRFPLIMKYQQKPRIALIADEYTRAGLAPEADIIHLTPANWRWHLTLGKRPDFLMVESSWRGYDDSWKGKIVDYGKNTALEHLVAKCRKRKIPTLFWNKEDPVCFTRFSEAAKLFDVIYTTDEGSLPGYRQLPDNGFQYVGILQFAAQPTIHYPGNDEERIAGIAFPGGYYGDEYPNRSRQQIDILSALTDMPLTVYDRFWSQKKQCSFPESLEPYCKKAVTLASFGSVYRRHQLYLNINTVSDSSTMLSRRVFELAACGSPMISTPSPALSRLFGDVVPQITNGEQARHWSQKFLQDKALRQRTGQHLYELVINQHTWRHRLQQISRETGFF